MKTLTPAFFFGHGSPFNALEKNIFSQKWEQIWKSIQKPKAILAISAHYETLWTYINNDVKQKTIYDFYGFPNELYQVDYSVSGEENIAKKIIQHIPEIQITQDFWLDHGVWSILVHMFPEKNIPVLTLSLDIKKTPQEHYELWKKLAFLREEWVMIFWSGNIVHNLSILDWNHQNTQYWWAYTFNETIKKSLEINDLETLLDFKNLPESEKAIAWKEHFLPLLYIFALKNSWEKIEFFNDTIQMWSISMTSFQIGT